MMIFKLFPKSNWDNSDSDSDTVKQSRSDTDKNTS